MEIEGLVESVTSLENENQELKGVIREMATKIGHQDMITGKWSKNWLQWNMQLPRLPDTSES